NPSGDISPNTKNSAPPVPGAVSPSRATVVSPLAAFQVKIVPSVAVVTPGPVTVVRNPTVLPLAIGTPIPLRTIPAGWPGAASPSGATGGGGAGGGRTHAPWLVAGVGVPPVAAVALTATDPSARTATPPNAVIAVPIVGAVSPDRIMSWTVAGVAPAQMP